MKYLKKIAIAICVLSFNLQAQTISVSGTVSSPQGVISYASVTFTNNNDPTEKYNAFTDSSGNYRVNIVTSVSSNDRNQPSAFELEQNYPNPFSSKTEIPYKLKSQSDVHITIYDILGRVVKRFSTTSQNRGLHSVVWDGRNNFGALASPGVYFYRVQVNDQSLVKKMVFNSSKGNFALPLAKTGFTSPNTVNKADEINIQAGSYTVQIDNTANTLPAIYSRQFTNVEIQNDTTIDFSVYGPDKAMVYLDSTQQNIRGFGAANIIPWRPDMTTAEVNLAFGNGPGQLGFSILRLRIPNTDNTSSFAANVPTAKLAESLGAIVIASPWTPPSSMKTNNNPVGGSLKESSYAGYAAHLKLFADYMANNGAPLYAVSLQNEPDVTVTYESCDWTADEFLNFCKNNAQNIGTRIIMPESFHFDHSLSDPTLEDSSAASHVSIIGGHIYGGGLAPYPLAKSKGKELWMTEHLDTDTSWSAVYATGKEINDCLNAGMNAYVWWYIVRFYGPINENGTATKRGYVMAQFSKFIRPGYYKSGSTDSPQRNVYVSAYKDSSSSKVVIVALNSTSEPVYQTFSVENGNAASFTPYTTSETKNVEQGSEINTTNGEFTYKLEPSSITTFVSK